VRCLECTAQVLSSLSDTVTPQGISAVLPLPSVAPPALIDLVLVLDGVRDPGNAGTLLRTAEAAGVHQVVFGPGAVDAFAPKVVRSAMGAHFRMSIAECDTWESVLEHAPALSSAYVATLGAALSYDEVDWRAPVVLIVGSEASGASEAALRVATPISIPMHGQVESLNAAMAGAVILFEAARQRRRQP
jgi:TrmH family RNA methyltransferase